MPFDLRQIRRIERRLEQVEDEVVDNSQRRVIAGLRSLLSELERSMVNLETDERGRIINSMQNIASAQDVLVGLEPAIQQIAQDAKSQIIEQLDEITEVANQLVEAAGFPKAADPLGRVNADVVREFLRLDLLPFNGGAESTARVIRAGIFNQIAGLGTFEDMVTQIRQDLGEGNPLNRHARTWAMSAVIGFEGQYMQSFLEPEQIGGWFYSGPLDAANRDFCHQRAGRVFTDDEIRDAIANNPIPGSSMRLPGGFNCRHVLVPVPVDDMPGIRKEIGRPVNSLGDEVDDG